MSPKSFDVCRSVLTSLVMQGKSWDLRWCVLTSSSLTYYRSLEDRNWGGAGTVLSLSSLKRFEAISSLVFQVPKCRLRQWTNSTGCTACTSLSERSVSLPLLQLYFYQRILQLRAAQEQEAHRWILCLKAAQLQQQKLAADGPNPSQQVATPSAAASSSSPAPSPRHKSASAACDGILLIHARANIASQDSHLLNTEARGVLPSHLLVEERRVSYSPLSEHAAASPFMSDALRQHFIDQAQSDGAARELGLRLDSKQATSSAATATEHEDEGADIGVRTGKTITFAE